MKTLTQMQRAGNVVLRKIRMDATGPHGRWREVEVKSDSLPSARRFVDADRTESWWLAPPIRDEVKAVSDRGEVALVGAEDFATEPTITRFEPRGAVTRTGAHANFGTYQYQEKVFEKFESAPLTRFIREATGIPNATWAIRPFSGKWPDDPELYIFVPLADSAHVSDAEATKVLMGGGKSAANERPGVKVEGDAVYIGGVRVDRRHGYFVRVIDLRSHQS